MFETIARMGVVVVYSLWGLVIFAMAMGILKYNFLKTAQLIMNGYLDKKQKTIEDLEKKFGRAVTSKAN